MPHNAVVQKEALQVCLKDMGAMENVGGRFTVRSFVSGGLVLFGLQRKVTAGQEERRADCRRGFDSGVEVISDLSSCVNLTPVFFILGCWCMSKSFLWMF